jgi:hypothetical protein
MLVSPPTQPRDPYRRQDGADVTCLPVKVYAGTWPGCATAGHIRATIRSVEGVLFPVPGSARHHPRHTDGLPTAAEMGLTSTATRCQEEAFLRLGRA